MGSTRPTILLIGDLAHTKKEWATFSEFAELKEFSGEKKTRRDFIQELKQGSYDDVVALYRSNQSTDITGPFDAELVSLLPPSLKYICHNGAGYDNIDVPACSARNLLISSTPIAVNSATADIALFLLLGALRRIHVPSTAVRANKWRGSNFQLGRDPQGKTLGILGMGGIGTEVAVRAKAFGMKVVYHNRTKLGKEVEERVGATLVDFDTLLQSDILSLNLSLNTKTTGIIGRTEFSKMKDGIVIVNTARGKLMDEAALVDALESGKVWSAGLDVYEEEPKIHPGLLNNDKVVLLPHIGTGTVETQRAMELLVLENIETAVKRGKLVTLIAEQEGLSAKL